MIRGLPGSNDQDLSQTECWVRSMVRDKLHLNSVAVEDERTHHTGKTSEDGQTPYLIAILLYKDQVIISSSKKFEGTGIHIN